MRSSVLSVSLSERATCNAKPVAAPHGEDAELHACQRLVREVLAAAAAAGERENLLADGQRGPLAERADGLPVRADCLDVARQLEAGTPDVEVRAERPLLDV